MLLAITENPGEDPELDKTDGIGCGPTGGGCSNGKPDGGIIIGNPVALPPEVGAKILLVFSRLIISLGTNLVNYYLTYFAGVGSRARNHAIQNQSARIAISMYV